MFAKLYESEQYGQILIKNDSSEDEGSGAEVRFYFQPEGLGVCSVSLNFNDSEAGHDQAEKAFSEITQEMAESVIEKAITELNSLMLADDESGD